MGSPDSSHVLPQARTSPLFPSTFSASPLLPGSARAFRTRLPSSPALRFPLVDPQEALQKGKGESLGPVGGFSRQHHKVPFVTPCAFDQPVKGGSKVKKKKKKKGRANAVNEADAGKRHVQAQSVVPGAALLFSHLPWGHSGGCLSADAFTRLMGGAGKGPGTSLGITIH